MRLPSRTLSCCCAHSLSRRPVSLLLLLERGVRAAPIHVQRDRDVAKFWLAPVALASASRFSAVELRQLQRLVEERREEFEEARNGFFMPEPDPRILEVSTTEDELQVVLADGRRLSTPLAWFPRLLHATSAQRAHFEILGDGIGIHWPDVDEDLSVEGLLRGAPAPSR